MCNDIFTVHKIIIAMQTFIMQTSIILKLHILDTSTSINCDKVFISGKYNSETEKNVFI